MFVNVFKDDGHFNHLCQMSYAVMKDILYKHHDSLEVFTVVLLDFLKHSLDSPNRFLFNKIHYFFPQIIPIILPSLLE